MTADLPGIRAGILKKALEVVPDDAILILASDGEGNSASPLAEFGPGLYQAEQPWSGDLVHPDDSDLDDPDQHSVWVLWPVN